MLMLVGFLNTERCHASESTPVDLVAVRMDLSGRGAWEVAMPDQAKRVTCETHYEYINRHGDVAPAGA